MPKTKKLIIGKKQLEVSRRELRRAIAETMEWDMEGLVDSIVRTSNGNSLRKEFVDKINEAIFKSTENGDWVNKKNSDLLIASLMRNPDFIQPLRALMAEEISRKISNLFNVAQEKAKLLEDSVEY